MAFIGDRNQRRTYDSERNAELIRKIAERDGLEEFALKIEDKEIGIRAALHCEKDEKHNLVVIWNVLAIFPLPVSSNERSDIIKLVKEALEAFGINHGKNENDVVTVKFSLEG